MRSIHQLVAGWAALAIIFGGGPADAAEPPPFEPTTIESPALVIAPPDFDGVDTEALADQLAPPTTQEVLAASFEPPAPAQSVFCPVAAPVRFTDTFGEARSGHRHVGVDLTAPMGTPSVAPVAGVVRFDRDSAGGLSWHLTAYDGTYYYGTHLSRFGPRSGPVEAGEVIGYVGQTGNASVPHLHFEIRPGGIGAASINPTPFANQYCARA